MTFDKEYISKTIARLITLLSPLLIFAFKEQQYMVFVLPVVSAIVEIFLDYYFTEKPFNVKIKGMESVTVSHGAYHNSPYNQMCWYLTQKCRMDKLNFSQYYTNTNGTILDKNIPLYTIANGTELDFMYGEERIFANIGKGENKDNVVLYTKNIDTLKKLILEVTQKYVEYIDNNKVKRYQLFTWGEVEYRKGWSSSSINVVKSRKNVFASEKNSIIFENTKKFYESRQMYDDKGFVYKRGFLLYGLPGTGKSSIVYAIAHELDMNIYKLSLLDSDHTLTLAAKSIPEKSIVLIEDIDTVKSMHHRDSAEEEEKSKKTNNTVNLETVLNLLDGYSYFASCLIFCTTNHINKLDPALIRFGRMDEQYEFTYADTKQISNMTEFYEVPHLYKQYEHKEITTAELTQICWAELNK